MDPPKDDIDTDAFQMGNCWNEVTSTSTKKEALNLQKSKSPELSAGWLPFLTSVTMWKLHHETFQLFTISDSVRSASQLLLSVFVLIKYSLMPVADPGFSWGGANFWVWDKNLYIPKATVQRRL